RVRALLDVAHRHPKKSFSSEGGMLPSMPDLHHAVQHAGGCLPGVWERSSRAARTSLNLNETRCKRSVSRRFVEMVLFGDHSIPLIPRKTFFGNANAVNPKLSPDGRWLAWIAPAAGVMNVWVAPRDDVTQARALTRQTERPIFEHEFART